MTTTEWRIEWLIKNTDIPADFLYSLDAEDADLFYKLEQPTWAPSPAA